MRKILKILQLRPKSGAGAVFWGLVLLGLIGVVVFATVGTFSNWRRAPVDAKAITLATKRCAADCRAIDHDEGCDAFCACQIKALVARAAPSDLEREWSKKSAEAFSPEFTKLVQRTTAECGADLVDRRFMHSCVAGCGQATPACLETCECILDHLRGKGDRTESTLKLVKQDSQPANPETESSMREVVGKCRSATSVGVSDAPPT